MNKQRSLRRSLRKSIPFWLVIGLMTAFAFYAVAEAGTVTMSLTDGMMRTSPPLLET